ncbi:hypothetical protein BBW68_13725 [Candidatus Erwinia dacicola]|uniref:E1-E2 ATPase family protein n=1 Tax=Candidatus Erwinia dacicola TaxID=252393 RepID=A0A1E7YWX7_9GAMM|nr:hypothetical protein BBW68_13725 [Candidatus Erwinia dacicola]
MVERQQGEKISDSCLNVDRLVLVLVVSEPGNSAIDRILHLIEEAEERRAPIEHLLDRFSRIYTPVITLMALLFAAEWQSWINKGLTLLLIGCPCALVISTPAAITHFRGHCCKVIDELAFRVIERLTFKDLYWPQH